MRIISGTEELIYVAVDFEEEQCKLLFEYCLTSLRWVAAKTTLDYATVKPATAVFLPLLR